MREFAFRERSLPAILEAQALTFPERILVRELATGLARSYSQTRDSAARLAGSMTATGIVPGDRVAIMCSNRIEFIDTWLGCGWSGAIAVPVNTAAKGLQLSHVLGNCDPKVLVIETGLLERLEGVDAELPSLERIWTVGGAADGVWRGARFEPLPDAGEPIEARAVHPGETLSILYTSGTTGPSKGAMCPHAQLYWYGMNTARHLGVTSDDVLYTVLPLFHINALNTFWQALLSGSTYVFGTRFSASGFWREVQDAGATVTYLLGAMIHILLKREPSHEERAHRLRIALCPALSSEVVEIVRERFGFLCVEGYGSTETNLTHSNRIGGFAAGTMGRPLPEVEAQVVNENDERVPAGIPGELVLRPTEPFSFSTGYWRMPDKTVEAWKNLWFHTGDRVVVGGDGVYRFLDRIKDAIRRRGENISSFEVEQALQTHPDVEIATAVAVPSELGEDEVMAFVVLRSGANLDPVEVIRHLEPHLAYFAIPRFLEFVDELPLTENGKVRKHALRERGVGPATWDRELAGVEIRR